ncbi:MAG TPA: hypothetical protein PKB02_02225 [Anaerohalosphaeraceae bacterium]|nr:hypothetical protein [Anaerohalosphaeraceae bacterium]
MYNSLYKRLSDYRKQGDAFGTITTIFIVIELRLKKWLCIPNNSPNNTFSDMTRILVADYNCPNRLIQAMNKVRRLRNQLAHGEISKADYSDAQFSLDVCQDFDRWLCLSRGA